MDCHEKIVIIGATSAIATEVARKYAREKQCVFVLVGRNQELLDVLLRDLIVRGANPSSEVIASPLDKPEVIPDVISLIFQHGSPDIALIAQGSLPDQRNCEADSLISWSELNLNGISPVLWAEAFVEPMLRAEGGVIAVIGSVAGDRGRKSNYVYGAAKSLVEKYVRGMQHRLHGTNVFPLLVKPGPVDTPMTQHLKESRQSLATTAEVASDICKAISQRKKVLYTPNKWAIIMTIIRILPDVIFNRINI